MGTRREYSLTDLLDDPVIGLLMKSDGVDRQSVEDLFATIERDRDEQQICGEPSVGL